MNEYQSASVLSQYLTFQAAGERYAVAIMKLREILPYTGVTKVPMAPGCIRGLINLRGNAIPVVDLALKLGVESAPVTQRSCVMIVDPPDGDEGSRAMGILVDSVSAVVELKTEELEETPTFGTRAPSEYLDGLARVNEEFIPIISLNRILSEESLFAEGPIQATKEEQGDASAQEAADTEAAGAEPTPDAEAPAPADGSDGATSEKRDEPSETKAPAAPSRAGRNKTSAQSRKRRSRR